MNIRCWHRLLAFVLAVALGIGTSLAAFQASAMLPDMAMSAGLGEHDSSPCGGCAGGGDDVDFGACMTMCWAGGPAVLPDSSAPSTDLRTQQHMGPADMTVGSPAHHPEPDPPKTLILG